MISSQRKWLALSKRILCSVVAKLKETV